MTTYTQNINTLSTIAVDTMTKDLANLVNSSGEKLLKHISAKGRIFVVNDAEKLKHPVLYGAGEATTYYDGALMDPSASFGGDTNNLGSAAQEHMKYAQFMLHTATRNINFPQAMPSGDIIPYVSNVMKVNMMDILNREENLFVRGEDSGTGDEAANGAITGDDGAPSTSIPASLAGVIVDGSTSVFGGIDADTHTHWAPQRVESTGGGNCSKLLEDLQTAILQSGFSEVERPDLVLTTQGVYEAFIDLLRAKSQINDAVIANLGTTSQLPFAGVMVDWSRYLASDVVWDNAGTPAAELPIIGINSNSLRLNVVAGGGVSEGSLGFIQKVGETAKHPLLPQLFDRVQYKRCWSVDAGRRSFFQIGSVTSTATA